MDAIVEKRSWRKIARFQRLFCIVLTVLLLGASLGGLYRIPFNDQYDMFFEPISQAETQSFQAERKISVGFLTSVLSVFHMVSLNQLTPWNFYSVYDAILETEESIFTDARGLAFLMVDSFSSDFTVTVYIASLMLLSVLTPIFLMVVLFRLLKKYCFPNVYSKQHTLYKGAMNLCRIVIRRIPLLFLLGGIVPRTTFDIAMIVLLSICGVGILVHMVSAWLKDYTKLQRKYLAMLQSVSFVGLFIGLVFCFAVRKSNLVLRITERMFLQKTIADVLAVFEGGTFSFEGEILYFVLGILFFVALIYTCRSFGNNLCRIAMTTNRLNPKDTSKGDACIASTVFPNIMTLIFFMCWNSSVELLFYGNELSYFIVAMVCVAAMTVVEVLILILRSTLCADLGEGGMDAVLEGSTYTAKTETYEMDEVRLYEDRH